MERKSEPKRRSCWKAARIQAQRRRRPQTGHILFLALVIRELLSPPIPRPMFFAAPADPEPLRPPNEYERGESFTPRNRPSGGRYTSRPSLTRLMHDLRRPAACGDARRILEGMIDDVITRRWVAERLDDGEVNRLAIYVRPGLSEEAIFSAWSAEARVPVDDDDGGPPPPALTP